MTSRDVLLLCLGAFAGGFTSQMGVHWFRWLCPRRNQRARLSYTIHFAAQGISFLGGEDMAVRMTKLGPNDVRNGFRVTVDPRDRHNDPAEIDGVATALVNVEGLVEILPGDNPKELIVVTLGSAANLGACQVTPKVDALIGEGVEELLGDPIDVELIGEKASTLGATIGVVEEIQ